MKQAVKKYKFETLLAMIFGNERVIRWEQERIIRTHRKLCRLQEKQDANKKRLNFYQSYSHIVEFECGFYKIYKPENNGAE